MRIIMLVAFMSLSTWAISGPQCTTEPANKWMDAKAFEQKLSQTYRIKNFKTTSGNCYEIYGFNKDGKKVEIYFNPVSGEIVKSKVQ